MLRLICLILLSISLWGCASSGYKQFYTSYFDHKNDPDMKLLEDGKEPEVFSTDNFERDSLILRSKRMVPVGYSSFNGGYESLDNAKQHAKEIGASLVLVNSEYTGTLTSTIPLFQPTSQTSYTSGSATAYSNYGNSTNLNFNATTTTYGTSVVPITSQQMRYDQHAVYFVKTMKNFRFGLNFNNLTPDLRRKIGRNTGLFINNVIEDTPAFYANIFRGDILIAVDGTPVINENQALQFMGSIPMSQKSSSLKLIRDNKELDVEVIFD